MLILGTTDQVPGELRIEFFVFGRNAGNNFPDESELITPVINREVRLVSEPFNILTENANTERVKGTDSESLRLGPLHHCSDPFSHFVGCFVGKGYCEYGIRANSLVQEICDSHRNHPSFARAGAGENENWSLGGGYRFKLLRVEIEETGHWKS